MKLRTLLIALYTFFIPLTLLAQTQAAVNVSEGGYGLVKTNLSIAYDHGFGTIQDGFSARVSYEAFRNNKFTLTANARYSSSEVSFNNSDLRDGFIPDKINLNGTHLLGQVGVTSTFKSRLFNKPLMAMAMLNSEWGDGGFARISGIAMGLLMLRANRTTQFGIGPLVMINTCSKIPAFLIFMYRHRLNDKWLINLYGGMFGIDYNPSKNDLISVGADVDIKAFYFKPGYETLPEKCRFTSTSFRPMAKYRRRLMQNLYLDLQGGLVVKMACRVTGVHSSKELINCKQSPSPFLQAQVSFSL
ncbi:MAG: hypothetical protein HDR88_07245 [Bacteroides sp.]|nr:hypothetical protein [Bacteroides sp.]